MLRVTATCALALFAMGCAAPTDRGETLYTIPYQGQTYPVVARYPAGQTLAQARANGRAVYEVIHPKRGMTCNGSVEDCRNTLVDLVDRVERLGDGSE